jgi:hypothetical protein
LFIGLGFLTSYILNHKSYDILSGCSLNSTNCSSTKLFCTGRDNRSIFGFCLLFGLFSGLILFLGTIIIIPILYFIINGILIIIYEIYESFNKTKENISLLSGSKTLHQKIDDDVSNDINLDIIDFDDSND